MPQRRTPARLSQNQRGKTDFLRSHRHDLRPQHPRHQLRTEAHAQYRFARCQPPPDTFGLRRNKRIKRVIIRPDRPAQHHQQIRVLQSGIGKIRLRRFVIGHLVAAACEQICQNTQILKRHMAHDGNRSHTFSFSDGLQPFKPHTEQKSPAAFSSSASLSICANRRQPY